MGLFDLGEQRGDLLHLADVAGQRFGRTAIGDDLVDHGLAVGLLAAGDDGVRAGSGQQLGDFGADTAAGAGDEGHLAREVEQVGCVHERIPCDRRW
jgi:hypothetical protein